MTLVVSALVLIVVWKSRWGCKKMRSLPGSPRGEKEQGDKEMKEIECAFSPDWSEGSSNSAHEGGW